MLPKPGVWMDRVKQVLAFPLYGAAAWLLWVLAQQLDATALAGALVGAGAFGALYPRLQAPFRLPPRDPVLYFVERLRDEAHRFAIGSHRARRKRDIREAGLQETPGIGPTRKRALLLHFGTLKEIERASIADLGKVPGISADSARRIFDFFHARPG